MPRENHKFRKPSMREEVTDYCGDKFLEELIEKCNETPYRVNQDYFRKRDKALVAVLFLTGGRVSEVLMLKKDNFDFENEEAKRNNAFLVKDMELLKKSMGIGKPKHETRTFPIWNDDPLVQYLYEWLPEIEHDLFSIGRYRAWQIVLEAGKRLDRPIHINPSWLREQREHYLIEKKGFSPYDVQAYFKFRHPPEIFRHREDWQNLLAVARRPKQEKVYEKTPYDAYKDIQKIIISGRKEVDIIDPFVDDSIFELYLDYVHPNASIKRARARNLEKLQKDSRFRNPILKSEFPTKFTIDI